MYNIQCNECKNVINGKIYETDIGKLCEECYNENYCKCHDCGKPIYYEDILRVITEDKQEYFICEDCYQKSDYVKCMYCDMVFKRHNTYYWKGDLYACEDCATFHGWFGRG